MVLPPPHRVRAFTREEFLHERWNYGTGQHVLFLAPTGKGKTTLCLQLLEVTNPPGRVDKLILAEKPRDLVLDSWRRHNNYRVVRQWPPISSITGFGRPPGYVLWPRHSFDPDRDDADHTRIMWRAMQDSYRRGRRILVKDEYLSPLDLQKITVTILTKGRSMDCGIWGGAQKPSHLPRWVYNNSTHLFLHNDPDLNNRKKFGEISGFDPRWIESIVRELPTHHFLYLCQDNGNGSAVACIVLP